MNFFDNFKVECTKNVATLMAQLPMALEIKSVKSKTERLFDLESKVLEIKDILSTNFNFFIRDFYNRYLPQNSSFHIDDSELMLIRKNTIDQFNLTIIPDFNQLMKILETFINRCKEANNNAWYK